MVKAFNNFVNNLKDQHRISQLSFCKQYLFLLGASSVTTQTLADLVKSKRDAVIAQKIERENARKKKAREDRERLAAAEREKEIARAERERRKILEVTAKRETEALKRKTIRNILNQCLAMAIDEKNKISVDANCLNYRSDFESLGFTFFDQTELTDDIARLTKVREELRSHLKRLNSDLEIADSKLEEYLADDQIPTSNVKNNCSRVTRRPIYSFRDGLEVLQELIFRRDELQLTIDKWADVRKFSPWKIKEAHPEIDHLRDALVLKAIDQRLLMARNKYREFLEWESDNINRANELTGFNKRSVSLLNEHDLVEQRLDKIEKLLSNNKRTTLTYMSWEKKLTAKKISDEYKKFNWPCSRQSKNFFTCISDYLIRNASKSEAKFLFKEIESETYNKLTFGRESLLIPD